MKTISRIAILFLTVLIAAGCTSTTPALPEATATQTIPTTLPPTFTPQPSPTLEPTSTPTPEPTPLYPLEGYGPVNFPAEINPLTGLKVDDPGLLNRRPIIVKVQNLPRYDRPQSGLSQADIVYEYYTEEGSTRFAAIFYGKDAELVAPIRSARHFDMHIIRMYKGVFIFGSADSRVFSRLVNAEFADRLILESERSAPAVYRLDPNGKNLLATNTKLIGAVLTNAKVDNSRQNLDGMYFNLQAPAGGEAAPQVYVRYSAAIYNRWDYDPNTGKYLRFSDTQNDINGAGEAYTQLTDQQNKQPITADNLVILCVRHEDREPDPKVEMPDASLLGQGDAYIARDGMIFKIQWKRLTEKDVVTLVDANGNPFPFKPGQTWIEVLGANPKIEKQDAATRFTFLKDW